MKITTQNHQLRLQLESEKGLSDECESDCCNTIDIDIEDINQAEIMIVGGATSTIQKLKKKTPKL